MTFTATEKAIAADREVKWRKRVYPNRILTKRMTKQKAEFEIAIMEEIAADYAAMADKERLL